MLIAIVAAALASLPTPSQRIERLVALARLDAVVHYFHPVVATRASSWDSLFAANVVRIADAPTSTEYRRRIVALMDALHDDAPTTTTPQRALEYNGFPSPSMPTSGGYVLHWRSASAAESYRVDMGERAHIDVRLSEKSSDTIATQKVPPFSAATEWRTAYPSAGYRILGAARVWSTIRLFYPYKALIGENWDDQLRAALLAVEQAHDALEYGRAIASFAAHIHDTHVTVGSMALYASLGVAPVGAATRLIENQLVITRIVDSSAAQAGLRVGDVVVSVDGSAIAERIKELTPLFAASTPQSLRFRLQSALLNGPEATVARLVVRSDTGGDRTVAVPRSTAFASRLNKHRRGSIIRVLPGNIGYIDLDRLPVTMVDSAFRMLAGTKAIVFDDRGYPLGTAWAIAPRLNEHGAGTTAAKFKRLVVPSPDTTRTRTYEFDQPIPSVPDVSRYTGRTVMLIDERTISQAEHTGLFFEAANSTVFIGSPSMGANGDVTNVLVPGNIGITFTGHDVRHADGRQLQRVGLEPNVAVSPTIAGIRAGRDEVLEAALRYVGGTGEVPPDTVHEAPPVSLPPEPAAPGWIQSTAGDAFRVGLDQAVFHSGTASGHITARGEWQGGFGSFAQLLKAEAYLGKRIQYAAWIRTRGVVGTGAGLWMRIDGDGGAIVLDNMMTRPLRGSADWTRVSIVLDVPKNAAGIAFGLLLSAAGEVWIDDASLEVVGPDVPTTSSASPMPDPAKVEEQRVRYANTPRAARNLGFEPDSSLRFR